MKSTKDIKMTSEIVKVEVETLTEGKKNGPKSK